MVIYYKQRSSRCIHMRKFSWHKTYEENIHILFSENTFLILTNEENCDLIIVYGNFYLKGKSENGKIKRKFL